MSEPRCGFPNCGQPDKTEDMRHRFTPELKHHAFVLNDAEQPKDAPEKLHLQRNVAGGDWLMVGNYTLAKVHAERPEHLDEIEQLLASRTQQAQGRVFDERDAGFIEAAAALYPDGAYERARLLTIAKAMR